MKFDLKVDSRTFHGVLHDHSRLVIPAFQRPYAWESRQWVQLWDDLTTRLDHDYLMGNVVLCGSDDGGELVIDGQQRLSTITLVLAVCRDYLWRQESQLAKTVGAGIHSDYIVGGGVVAERHDPYLTLGVVDKEWFRKRIQVSPESAGEFDPPDVLRVPYKQPSSNRLLWRAYQYFYRQIEKRHQKGFGSIEEKVDDIKRLARQLANKTWFVITRVPDDTQAYTLFEVLNDRGLELSISDLIKNVVLSKASELSKLDRVKSLWSDISDALDYENISAFLRYYWMSTNGKKITESDLFPKLKEEIRKKSGPDLVAFLKALADEAGNFAQITGREASGEDVGDQLALVRAYGFRVVNSLLLALWAVSKNQKIRLRGVTALKNFLVQYAVLGNQVTNELEGILAELALDLRREGEDGLEGVLKRLNKKLPRPEVVWSGFAELEPSVAVARALLMEIEAHLSGDEKKIAGTEKVNVEHIFPQSPDEKWIKLFGADGAEDGYTSRLGNLTLLSAKLNKQASNKAFSEKVTVHYSQSEFKITQALKEFSRWNVDAVEERQRNLLETAKAVWGKVG